MTSGIGGFDDDRPDVDEGGRDMEVRPTVSSEGESAPEESLRLRLGAAECRNHALERELETVVAEAVVAQEALRQCAEVAGAELTAASQRPPPSAQQLAGAESDAEALAEALFASEAALEVALDERTGLERSFAEANHSHLSMIRTLESEISKLEVESPMGTRFSISGGCTPEQHIQFLTNELAEAMGANAKLARELQKSRSKESMGRCKTLPNHAVPPVASANELAMEGAYEDPERFAEDAHSRGGVASCPVAAMRAGCGSSGEAEAEAEAEDARALEARLSSARQEAGVAEEASRRLREELAQQEAEFTARARRTDQELVTLRTSLADLWSKTANQASECVTTLVGMQSQLMHLQAADPEGASPGATSAERAAHEEGFGNPSPRPAHLANGV